MTVPKVQRKQICQIAVVVCVLFFVPGFRAQSNADGANVTGGFRVGGVVVSSATGAPLAQARVMLINVKNRREGVSMITEENGHFEFTGLNGGKYSLEGARRGYIPAAYEQHEQYSTAIVTGQEFDTQNLTLRRVPLGMLSGMVMDEFGEGVRNAQVRLFAESHRGGATRIVQFSGTGTDDRGTFEFSELGPGKYYVSVSATPWYAVHVSTLNPVGGSGPAPGMDQSLDVAYPTTFYGGATESDEALPISVEAGEHAQIDIQLSPVPALHLLFQAPKNSDHGYQFPTLQRRTFDTLEGVAPGGVQGSPTTPGLFEISGIPPGKYSVRLPDNSSGQMKLGGEVELDEDGLDLSELEGEPLSSVKLSVKMSKDELVPRGMNIGLQDEKNRIVAWNQVDADGEVAFEDLPAGRYGIRIFVPAKAYSVTRMRSADTEISGHELTLRPGESQEWTAFLSLGRTNIEGYVKRGNKAASGVMVVLIPNEPKAHLDVFRRDQSDSDGSFLLPDVIPGSYTVVAIEDAWGFDWSQPALLARYAQHGQALTVGELMQGVVSLPDAVEVQPR
ncbi:MAG: carboxypeptidase regulatory-like domain-containing protein [Candidatus Acidiferrum sp.]